MAQAVAVARRACTGGRGSRASGARRHPPTCRRRPRSRRARAVGSPLASGTISCVPAPMWASTASASCARKIAAGSVPRPRTLASGRDHYGRAAMERTRAARCSGAAGGDGDAAARRDGGLEVFMLQRTHSAAFARSQYVFPGGRVDDADHGDDFEPVCDALDDAAASAQARARPRWAGVVRRRDPRVLRGSRRAARPATRTATPWSSFDDPGVAERFNAARHRVHAGDGSLVELCVAERPAAAAGAARSSSPTG